MRNLKAIKLVKNGELYFFSGNSVEYLTAEAYEALETKNETTNYAIINDRNLIEYYYLNGDLYTASGGISEELEVILDELNLVTAAALNDLNDRLKSVGSPWYGTKEEYNNLPSIDQDRLYFITESQPISVNFLNANWTQTGEYEFTFTFTSTSTYNASFIIGSCSNCKIYCNIPKIGCLVTAMYSEEAQVNSFVDEGISSYNFLNLANSTNTFVLTASTTTNYLDDIYGKKAVITVEPTKICVAIYFNGTPLDISGIELISNIQQEIISRNNVDFEVISSSLNDLNLRILTLTPDAEETTSTNTNEVLLTFDEYELVKNNLNPEKTYYIYHEGEEFEETEDIDVHLSKSDFDALETVNTNKTYYIYVED